MNMFQIQLHIILADFCPPWYGTYTQIRVPLRYLSCKLPYDVVTRLLIIVRSVCWLALMVFPFRIGRVFHVKSCVSAVIDLVFFVIYSSSFTTSGIKVVGCRLGLHDDVDEV
jgi:hypothetical protein